MTFLKSTSPRGKWWVWEERREAEVCYNKNPKTRSVWGRWAANDSSSQFSLCWKKPNSLPLWLLVNITYIYSKPKPVVNIINQKLDPFPRAWPNTTVAESDRTEDLNWIMAFQQRAGCILTTCKLMQPSLQPLEK